MAKKKTRDPEKRAALAAKKEAKQEKAARKRTSKETGGVVGNDGGDHSSDGDDDDDNLDWNDDVNIDRLLQKYKQRNALAVSGGTGGGASSCQVIPCDGFPLARAHATLTITTDDSKKKKEAYLFGGEYHDGAVTVVSDQLFKYELATNKWKQLITGMTPPPRCSHSAAYYNKCLYIFGGEHNSASSSEYHHYKDVWKFDTVQQQWSEIKASSSSSSSSSSGTSSRGVSGNAISIMSTTPSARSGTSIVVWKHFMILFGGFTEAADQAAKWHNDVYVLNLQTEQWIPIPYSRLAVRPEPRSACHTALLVETDQWLVHGGFSKLAASSRQQQLAQQQQQQLQHLDDGSNLESQLPVAETVVHTDAWVLHLRPLLDDKPPTWERWTSSLSRSKRVESAMSVHNGRSGVGAVAYGSGSNNTNMLLFGGVVDQELHHHKVDSVFYNDLSLFHVEKRKFIPIRLAAAGPAAAATAATAESSTMESDDNDNDEAVANDLVLNSNDENAPVDPASSGWDLSKLRSSMFAFVDGEGNVIYEKIDAVKQRLDNEREEEAKQQQHAKVDAVERTEPLPRIKACLFLNGHTLYVYGGLVEVGDREVTLDDMWSIDLRKNRKWHCLYSGTMHQQVWRGAVHDDDDSYCSGSHNASAGAATTKSDRRIATSTGSHHAEEDSDEEEETKEEEKEEKMSFASIKEEMVYLVEKHQLGDEQQSPLPGETFDEFHARTADFWSQRADQLGKRRADAKQLARHRFESLEPIIEHMMELKLRRKQEKAQEKGSKTKTGKK